MSEQKIKNWSVLNSLSKDFTKNIKQMYVFGVNGKQVIAITNDDNVYSFGDKESYGCLGLGHTNAVQQPTKIEELCAKQVIHFEFCTSYYFVLALTQNGDIYSWGYNGNGELGIGSTTAQYRPTIIIALRGKNVTDIKSGLNHSLALTVCGDVYIWGHQIGSTPTKMSFVATNQKIIAISSGNQHALALTNTGNVYYWGNNTYGQCGNGNNNHSYVNNWCESQNTIELYVKKIACGPYHSIILSIKVIVYCFGRNEFGQCGDGTIVNKNIPTKVNINAQFIDISATKLNISVGLTGNGCYIWGQCGQNSLNKPIDLPFNDMNEVLQHYSANIVTLQPIRFTDKDYKRSSIMDRISDKFNKREFSDIAFKVEDKLIYAQKSYLINVCKYFEVLFLDNNWIESNISEIEIKNYSYNVYYAFIKYLYTDFVDISKDDDAIQLLDLANCYLDETLKQRCVELIKNTITNENVFCIYYSAVKYNSKELKAFCIEYIKNNLKDDETNMEAIMDNAVKFTEK